MDHRVSKDMISSGMTPSGKKSQADLGKTQYGSAPSPNRLMDAYHSMYQNQKEGTLNEGMVGDVIKKGKNFLDTATSEAEKNKRRAIARTTLERENSKESVDLVAAYQSIYADTFEEGKIPAGLQAYLDKKKGKKKDDDNGDDNGDEKKSKKKKGKGKGSKPDFLDLDKDGDKKEPMKKASKEMKEGAGLNEEPVTTAMTVLKGLKTAGKVLNTMKNSKVAQNLMKAKTTVDNVSNVANTVRGAGSSIKDNLSVKKPPTTSTVSNKTTYQAASVDLFDIVKGQLIDEGLSEEEIRDIMLELTPEEILNEMGKATPEAGTGKYYNEKNPTPKQKEIQKNLPQNRKPTPEQQAARDKYAKIRDMTNKGDHQGASKLYNS